MDAKKHPALIATLAGLGLVALTGVVLAGLEYGSYSNSSDKLARSDKSVEALLSGARIDGLPDKPVALTSDNRDAAAANLAALKAAEAALRDNLAGATPAARFESSNSSARIPDAGELGSIIKESVERWRAACHEAGVKLAVAKVDDFAFGFSRYFRTGVNPQKSLHEIHRQTRIVDFLVKSLIEAKLDGEVRLVAVDRDPVELPAGTKNFNKDEVSGLTDKVFRRDGLLRSEFYRVRFVGKSDVLRRLVNVVTDSGRAITVRGVEVVTAAPELLVNPPEPGAANNGSAVAAAALPAGLFGEATPAPAAGDTAVAEAKSEVVVPDAPSDITVTFEFIEPVKPEVADPTDPASAPTKPAASN
jgi:hypothetical protein